ncbi:two-component system phosphate regulon sensor histidine kinase PhoR [Mucilaginibacter yixingensis]|uniref:histidine kinase n=1 Tax=Mucilaginibacter yixingensis TaxID=1295612 RepID=A0A2T5J8D8_9SPHI|nr:HAMP domain-containing sensor histidine kinase [Mucilaginibacter yixingensis]PTQ95659.1 two-component system phosphate regulon sensor histidine kinase PhoR [Mucilaginibacter yixingensis]
MKKRSITLIIGLMGSALLGVLAMQLYFLVQTYQLQSRQFDSTVYEALDNVVSKVAKQDAINFINARTRMPQARIKSAELRSTVTFVNDTGHNSPQRNRRRRFVRDSLKNESKRLSAELAYPDQQGTFSIRWRYETYTDEYGYTHQQRLPEFEITPLTGDALKQHKLHRYDTLHYDYIDAQLGRQVVNVIQENPFWKAEQVHRQKVRQLRNIKKILAQDSLQTMKEGNSSSRSMFANIADEYRKMDEPLRTRLDPMLIDSLLRFELQNKGITLPFSYEVTNANNDSLIFSNASNVEANTKPKFINADFHKPIFTKDVINDPGMLRIKFPEKNSLILSNMAFGMATSGGLLLILIFCFGFTIFSILRQKKISEMKTDFINNMTHEFKTPVSTIMIASEALKDEDIASDKTRIARLANVIYEENARLGSHIERVLNIARIEKNDFRLDIKPVDVNEMITAVVDSMSLKLQKYGAQTTMHLDAMDALIEADELHFSNVIYNLIDNAIKYSRNAPEITINTFNTKGQLVIVVADKGIGMSREHQARIFEQFYRVPTGNLHDVKGFGLGLSYVNTIIKRLDGDISVRSEKEKGSEFELRFPLAS